MTLGLKREGKPLTLEAMKELGDFYTEKFKENIDELNIQSPTVMPKASEHIQEDIDLIKTLEDKGYVYQTSDGLYFDTSKFKNYGILGGLSSPDENVARINENKEKKNPRDFAVWKFNKKLGFESHWGQGFPGWHIECSAMSMKYLGPTFDIHTGGIDHIPVHHNNEIAQSEAATGKKFVNYWLHENFLNINDTKISKSLKNFYTLKDLQEKNIEPLAFRYWLLTAHYRSPVNFTWEAVEGAQSAYDRLKNNFLDLGIKTGIADHKHLALFTEYINDDLNTPKAVALIWEVLADKLLANENKRATLLAFDKVLGLGLEDFTAARIPAEVQKLVTEREHARQNKDWKKADLLRGEIAGKGFEVKDTDSGPRLYPLTSTA
jgi:cysteinyl-tRNA synthetase